MIGRGFSFCGIHTDQMGLVWEELPQEIFSVDHEIDYKSETVSGVPGSIPYGFDVKPKEFKMVCGFENLNEQQRGRIGSWLRAGQYGKLVMDHRPYCYYNCVVTSTVKWGDTFPMINPMTGTYLLSGHMEFTLTAFVPYAYLLEDLTLNQAAQKGMLASVLDGTALLAEDQQPSHIWNHAYLHNAGNAPAKLHILLEGIPGSEGVEIINHTTGQSLHIAGDTAPHVYHIDSAYGRVEELSGDDVKLASHVHSGDYLDVSPGCPIERDISYVQTGTRIIPHNYVAQQTDVGRFFYHGMWSKVTEVRDGCLIVENEGSGSGTGILTQLNDIEIIRGEDGSFTATLTIQPTFY